MEISSNAALIGAVNKMLTERECQPCQKYDACEYCDTNITIKKLTELQDTNEEECEEEEIELRLEDCPFCGAPADIEEARMYIPVKYRVVCSHKKGCYLTILSIHAGYLYKSPEAVAEAWNRRECEKC